MIAAITMSIKKQKVPVGFHVNRNNRSKRLQYLLANDFMHSSWIACEKTFDVPNLPEYVVKAFNEAMQIPANPYSMLLETNTPISTILSSSLPKIHSCPPASLPFLSEPPFSFKHPMVPTNWSNMDILPLSFSHALARVVGQAWMDGNCSIRHYTAPKMHLPLWFVHWWFRMGLLLHCRTKWTDAQREIGLIKQGINSEIQMDLTRFGSNLNSLGWGIWLGGFATECTLLSVDIADMLGRNWVNDHQIDALYLGLRLRVVQDAADNPSLQGIEVGTLLLFHTLQSREWGMYNKDSRPPLRSLWKLAEDLPTGRIKELYFPIHVNNNHYQAVCVDTKLRRVSFGCGLGWDMPKSNKTSLTQWLQNHEFSDPTIYDLRAPRQDDSYSCAWVSLATHEHYIFGSQPWSPQHKDVFRLKKIAEILETNQEVRVNTYLFKTYLFIGTLH